MKLNVFWFRRDLRTDDNTALNHALKQGLPVLPIFIFDENILAELPNSDARVNFIYDELFKIHQSFQSFQSGIKIFKGKPKEVWKQIISKFEIEQVFCNKDFESYGVQRDQEIEEILSSKNILLNTYVDHIIFKPGDVLKPDNKPYTIFTPFKKKWLEHFSQIRDWTYDSPNFQSLFKSKFDFPSKQELNIEESNIKVLPYNLNLLDQYSTNRDVPSIDGTSYLGPHLRFGTISVRRIIDQLSPEHSVFLSELIWREFFMHIMHFFPHVTSGNFNAKYDGIQWENNETLFEKWKTGNTGYPIVDAGMRQLNATGYMHNRVRMITASFLCKHLLIDWRWGEAYFAEKLLDFELASNNGNWQWAAGTGCDAAPYFRVFSPSEQTKKFDNQLKYIQKWVPELNELTYPQPIVDHKIARVKAVETYKKGIERSSIQ